MAEKGSRGPCGMKWPGITYLYLQGDLSSCFLAFVDLRTKDPSQSRYTCTPYSFVTGLASPWNFCCVQTDTKGLSLSVDYSD